MNFSAAELVKRSAAQLLLFAIKAKNYKPTAGQLKGNSYAEKVVEKEGGSAERRGTVAIDNNKLIFFCVDLVQNNKFIEIKHIDPERSLEEWYLQSSLLQSAFYAALLEDVDVLFTPKFKRKEGYKQEVTPVPTLKTFELWFGNEKYQVFPNQTLKQHYINKAKLLEEALAIESFDMCREFDTEFKHKEYDIFKPKFTVIVDALNEKY